MSKFCSFGRKVASTASTASTFSRHTVEALLSQSRYRVEALVLLMVRSFSRLKSCLFRTESRGSRGTSPNFAVEIEKEGYDYPAHDSDDYWLHIPPYGADEFDHEDFDEWWDAVEDGESAFDHLSAMPEESWHKRAVDEAIEEENKPYDPTSGDIPF